MMASSPPFAPRFAPVNETRRQPTSSAASMMRSLCATSLVRSWALSPPKLVPWMQAGRMPRVGAALLQIDHLGRRDGRRIPGVELDVPKAQFGHDAKAFSKIVVAESVTGDGSAGQTDHA